MKLNEKVAIVTGAGRGIGRAISLCLAKEGADIAVCSMQEKTTESTASEVRSLGRKALAIPGDITQRENIAKAVQKTIDTFGKIDILVNNVGGLPALPMNLDDDPLAKVEIEWDGTYAQNMKATALMCYAVAPYFIRQKSGKIVNISSGSARMPSARSSPSYGTMKAAILRFSQSLAEELGPYNINVNSICPGPIWTSAWEKNAKRFVEKPEYKELQPREWFLKFVRGEYPQLRRVPLRKEIKPEDIGNAVVFFASEDASSITGQALNVDGGERKN